MVLVKISRRCLVGNRHTWDKAGGVMAGRKVFALPAHSGNQPNEFVRPGMLEGAWRGEGKYFMHVFKKRHVRRAFPMDIPAGAPVGGKIESG